MTTTQPAVRLLVCGTAERGDDGAALAAAARLLPTLSRELCAHLEVRRCTQLDPADLTDVPAGTACIVMDTVVGIEPGAIVLISFPALVARTSSATLRSAHVLPVDEALRAVEAARGRLPEGMLVGIGGKWFGYGRRFSRAVKSGIPALGEAVVGQLEHFAQPH